MMASTNAVVRALLAATSMLSTYASVLRGHADTVLSPSLVETNASDFSAPLPFVNTTGPNRALEDEVNDLFKMTALRNSMTKEQFQATPFGKSVDKIFHLIEKVMMPQVMHAHNVSQTELGNLKASLDKCGTTKNELLLKADEKKVKYLEYSPKHKTCRAAEAGLYTEKAECWEEEADKHKVKELMCNTFAMVSKHSGDQQATRQITKKGGSEAVESYVNRITQTICGSCTPKSCEPDKDGVKPEKCGYAPYKCECGIKCKYDKARDNCAKATHDHAVHKKKCEGIDKQYREKRSECDSLQDQMDGAACNRAVETKDACESYDECHFDKTDSYQSLEKMVKTEETDRKAEWRGLKRMKCLIGAFAGGKITEAALDKCRDTTHTTDHLTVKYDDLQPLEKCEVPHLYPNTPTYKKENFLPLPALAKGKQDGFECSGIKEISTTPAEGSPKSCKCARVTLNGPYSPGAMVKCENCLDVRRSLEKNSCPDGTKLFSPQSASDWKTFMKSAPPLRAPSFIIDITRPKNGMDHGRLTQPMNSHSPNQKTWKTTDGSPWFLRNSTYTEPNGDYHANCYMNLAKTPFRDEHHVTFNDHNCNFHSKSYYCQSSELNLIPKPGSPDGCVCKEVTLNGKYSAGALMKCTGCLRVSKSMEKNSCPIGTKLFSPRTREDWATFIASATPLRSPNWIIDITQTQNGCGGCTRNPMNSRSPAQATWRTSDNTPWFLRSEKYSEPDGDYHANCYLDVLKADSEDSVTFNDNSCKVNSNSYYCQTAKKKPPPPVEEEEEEEEMPPPPPPMGGPLEGIVPKKGSTNVGFICMGGEYTGANAKCGHFEGLSKDECWKKCTTSASAGDKDGCDKVTGVPECVAMVHDANMGRCMLHRECTKMHKIPPPPPGEEMPPNPDGSSFSTDKIVAKLKDSYDPEAKIFDRIEDMRCKGDPYTKPDGDKKGLEGVTEEECADACFKNKWVGDKKVPVEKCAAAVYYKEKKYCDFYEKDECEKTKKKEGAVLLKKKTALDDKKKEEDNDNDNDDDF